jgi:purine nucleoside permease
MPVKVVIVTLFEPGEDTGDRPGEYQFWVEREHLDRKLEIPGTYRPLRYRDDGVLAVCTGGGIARTAAVIAALARDPRFDFRKAYWITAGIAGIDPADGTLGSAAWAEYIVDGDLAMKLTHAKSRLTGPRGMCRSASPNRTNSPRKTVWATWCSDSIPAWSIGPIA